MKGICRVCGREKELNENRECYDCIIDMVLGNPIRVHRLRESQQKQEIITILGWNFTGLVPRKISRILKAISSRMHRHA